LYVIDDARPPRQALAFALPGRGEEPSRLDELDQLLRSITRQLAFAGYQFGATRSLADIEGVELLNERERETLALVVSGVDVAGIAARLFVSQSTVRNYLSAIYTKLGVGNRSELLALVLGGEGTGSAARLPGADEALADAVDEDDHARRRLA
jgi:DNA-binding NarL/FixJ family response regulator